MADTCLLVSSSVHYHIKIMDQIDNNIKTKKRLWTLKKKKKQLLNIDSIIPETNEVAYHFLLTII